MSKQVTKKSAKKALELLKSLQTQLSTKSKEATIEDVLNVLEKEEAALEKKRENVLKRQQKVDEMLTTLKDNKKTKKAKTDDKIQDMVPRFQKWYDADNRPVVTICSVKRGKIMYEGWAICSDVENPRHKKGENIALKRVAEVLVTKKNTLPIQREDAKDILNHINIHKNLDYKSRCYEYVE